MHLHDWGKTFGDEQYSNTFKAMIKKSFEKTQSPMIVGGFISALGKLGIFHPGKGGLNFLDIASDDGGTLERIIKSSGNLNNINLHAIDYKNEAIEKFKMRFGDLKPRCDSVNLVNTAVGNAFSGNLVKKLGIKKNEINIVIVSHLIYGVDKSEVEVLMKDIRENVLSPNGIALLIHVKDGLDSHVYLRNKYGSRAERDISASENKISDPSTAIREAVIHSGGKIRGIKYKTRTYFDKMNDTDWEEIKDPANFKRLSAHANVLDNILRLSFIPLRTPQDMATDTTGRNWSRYVDEVRPMIKTDYLENDEPYLEDQISLQVVLPNTANSELERKVDEVLNLVSYKLEEINSRAQKEFFRTK